MRRVVLWFFHGLTPTLPSHARRAIAIIKMDACKFIVLRAGRDISRDLRDVQPISSRTSNSREGNGCSVGFTKCESRVFNMLKRYFNGSTTVLPICQ